MAFPDVTTVFDDGIRGSYPQPINLGGGDGANWDSVPIITGSTLWQIPSVGQIANNSNGAEAVSLAQFGPNSIFFVTFLNAVTFSSTIYFALWISSTGNSGSNVFPVAAINGYAIVGGLAGTNQLTIRSYPSGSTIAGPVTQAIGAGDALGIRQVGSALELWYKAVAGSWTMIASTTDSTYSRAGRLCVEGNGIVLSQIQGGTITGGTTFTKTLAAASTVAAQKSGLVAALRAGSTTVGATRRSAVARTVSAASSTSAVKTASAARLASLGAAVSAIGARAQSPSRSLLGVSTPVVSKSASLAITRPTSTPVIATVQKSSARTLGAATSAGAAVAQLKAKLATLVATSGVVAAIARSVAASRRGASSPSATKTAVASVTRSTSSATGASVGAIRAKFLTFAAASTGAATIRRSVSVFRDGATVPSGSLKRAGTVSRAAASVTQAVMGRRLSRTLQGALSAVASVVRFVIPPDTATRPANLSVVVEPVSLVACANTADELSIVCESVSVLSTVEEPA